jgi:hypothetical protein
MRDAGNHDTGKLESLTPGKRDKRIEQISGINEHGKYVTGAPEAALLWRHAGGSRGIKPDFANNNENTRHR